MEDAASWLSLIGRRVRIVAWADYADLFGYYSRYGSLPPEPVGEVTGVGDYGAGHLEVQLQIPGLPRPFVFDVHELELLS